MDFFLNSPLLNNFFKVFSSSSINVISTDLEVKTSGLPNNES